MSIKKEEDIVSFIEGIKRQWVAMIDAIADPIVMIDTDGVIVKTNKAMADLFGTSIGSIIGKNSGELFKEKAMPAPLDLVKKAKGSSAAKKQHSVSTSQDQHFEVSTQNFLDENGKHEGYVLLYNDVTDSKKLQSQLVQSEKLASIGLLAGGIAHEINNPLGGILVFSQMILREMSPKDQHYSDVEEILHATERCKAIVDNLLEFARQSPSNQDQSKQKADLKDALETSIRFVTLGLRDQNIEVEWENNGDSIHVAADRNKIIQLFLNLMQNACQAMPNGGVLTLKAEKNGKSVVVEVKDTGTGIPKEMQNKIFDPFYTTKDPGEGTGLGLAICYGIVEDMGGKINLESKENEGSTFRVTLPLHKEENIKSAS